MAGVDPEQVLFFGGSFISKIYFEYFIHFLKNEISI